MWGEGIWKGKQETSLVWEEIQSVWMVPPYRQAQYIKHLKKITTLRY